MDDMVPRSRLVAVERELADAKQELDRVRAVARPFIKVAQMVIEEYGPGGGDWQSVARAARVAFASSRDQHSISGEKR